MSVRPHEGRPLLRSIPFRVAAVVILWWALVEGDWRGVILTLAILAAAVMLSIRLLPPAGWRLSLTGLARFIPFFAFATIRGSIDVARRALEPHPSLQPGFIELDIHLPAGVPRLLFVGLVSLIPGTLSADATDSEEALRLRVHLLDERMPAEVKLRELEKRVAAIFEVR